MKNNTVNTLRKTVAMVVIMGLLISLGNVRMFRGKRCASFMLVAQFSMIDGEGRYAENQHDKAKNEHSHNRTL